MATLIALSVVGLGCRDTPTPSPWRVQLTGVVAETKRAGEARSYFDAAHAPRWRVEPSPDGPAWLDLEPAGGGPAERVEATIEPRGSFGIVRTATSSARGRYRARLNLGERVVWQGNLHFIPLPEARPEIVQATKRWAERPTLGAAAFEPLTASTDPMMRFAAYLAWGRLAWTRSSTEAGRIWGRGGDDPSLVEHAPRAAGYLASSAVFTLVDSGQVEAAERAVDALEARDGVGPEIGVATAHYVRGRIAWARGQPAQTLRWLRSSLESSWATGDDNTWAVTGGLLAGAYLHLGRFRESLQLSRAAVPRARRARTQVIARGDVLWTRLWGQAARVFVADQDGLVRDYEAILPDFEKLQRPSNVAVTRAVLAYLALRRGDRAVAEQWMRPVFRIPSEELGVERWFVRLVGAELLIERGDFDAAQAELQAIRSGARAEVGRVGADEVVALRLLAEIARRQGAPALARERLHAAWRASLDAARQIDLVGARNNYLHLQRELPVALARTYIDEGDPLSALAVLEETLYERWAQLRAFDSVESQPEAWAKLEAARGAARTAESANCEAGDAAARVGCRKRRSDAQAAVRAAKMALFAALDVPRRADHRAAVARVQKSLSASRGVLVSLDGDERRLTMLMTRDQIHVAGGAGGLDGLEGPLSKLEAVAVVGSLDLSAQVSPTGTPWAARLAISRWPSVVWTARAAPQLIGPAAIVADPRGDLPKARAGALVLAADLDAEAFIGVDATPKRLYELLQSERSVVLFSGHGEELDYDHSSTRILLSGGVMDMQDVLTKRLRAGLVVLNGCSTAGSSRGYGVGLPEALLLQGSSAVLATVETVTDAESTRFLARFFDAGGAKTPAKAFRAAVSASVEANDDVWRRYRLWAR